MARAGHKLTAPATKSELANSLKVIDGLGWLPGGIRSWKVLCLAAGGGRHGPLYASAGAEVTVVDLSPVMLERDRQVAAEHGLQVNTIQTSMDQLDMLPSAMFDLVVQPVSSCYLPTLDALFPEVARVTKPQGIYISQHKQPANLQASLDTYTGHYAIEHAYYDRRPVPPAVTPNLLREPGTQEFVHSWNDLLGGICRSGFVIEDVSEPSYGKSDALPGSFGHRCYFIAPYLRIKARRLGSATTPRLITF
ncbi:MAG: class I SAM-dependent methyltransferase [Pirellulaceae bacterium]|nr:class I SAM-dependent methyltransferase [Pirellulaceae bacterium]